MLISYTDKILLEDVACIFLLQSEDEKGDSFFAYIAVDGGKLEAFKHAISQTLFHPERYGTLLLFGKGEPSLEERRQMELRYGFNHRAMCSLA